MSLTASMWTSVSGLLAHGEKMNVIGNNISNVNTVGYKAQRMDFQDFVYQYIGTAAGMGQVGRGTSIGIVMNDFSQGSHETTTSATDIAIQGNGFFQVKPLNNNVSYYTRAGNFTFNKDGYLVDPHGYALQGWKIDRDLASQSASGTSRSNSGIVGSGSPVDVCLDTFTCPPRHTTQMSLPVNLKYDKVATVEDHSTDPDNPFFSLIQQWDATQEPPLGQNQRAYQTTMEVYDEGGRMHKLTVYFDRVSGSSDPSAENYIEGYTDSETYWEYIVTMEPGDDVRDFNSVYDPHGMAPTMPNVPERLKGLLASGTITFSSSGAMKDMSCFVPNADPANPTDTWWQGAPGQEVVDLNKFIAAPLNSNGYPVLAPNFSGTAGMQTAYGYDDSGAIIDPTKPNPHAQNRLIALDFGMSSKANAWQFLPDPDGRLPGTGAGGLVTAAGVSRTFIEQEKDANGNLVWKNGIYTLQAPSTVTKAEIDAIGSWQAGTPPSNATKWTHTYTTSGTPSHTLTFENASSTTPTLNVAPASPSPDNNVSNFTAGGFNMIYRRADPEGSAHPTNPDISNATWAPASPGQEILNSVTYNVFVDGAGNKIYIDSTQVGAPQTATDLSTAFAATPPNITGNAALSTLTGVAADDESYWAASDGYTMQNFTTTTNTLPAGTPVGAPASNATEYYWQPNPDIAGVRVTSTNSTPPAGALAWNPSMQTVHRSSKYFVNGMDGQAKVDPTYATTCLDGSFFEHNGARQDGYPYGSLRYVSVGTDGVLSAAYSNGETLQLYQIVLYDFPSNQNLRREGGNLFTETRESGVPSSGAAGTGTFGTTHGSSLEQSNADLSREFVNMITTQRGFQANSKTITTVDTMLETVIGMKR